MAQSGGGVMDPVTLAIAKNRLGLVSVKDFGARGDGETDDTDAFVKAAQAGKHIYVPTGEYVIDATLDEDNLTIEGDGTIVGTLTLTGERLSVRNIKFAGTLRLDYAGHINVHNVEIDASGENYGIEAIHSHWLTIDNCRVRNAANANIHIKQMNTSATRITNCIVSYSGGNGIEFVRAARDGDVTPSNSIGQVVSGNTIVHNAHYGLLIDGTHDNLITSNTFERNRGGGILNSRIVETTISANWFEYNSGAGADYAQAAIALSLEDTMTVDTGVGSCLVSANQTQGERRAVRILGVDRTPHIIGITSNTIGSDPDAAPAIQVDDYDSAYRINISNNTFFSNKSDTPNSGVAIRVRSSSDNVQNGENLWISGNYITYYGYALQLWHITNATFDGNFVYMSQPPNNGTIYLYSTSSIDMRFNRFREVSRVFGDSGTYTSWGNEGLADT